MIFDDEELEKRKESRIPPNTRIISISIILNITDNEELNYWLSKLVVEVRNEKDPGTVYPPNCLYQLLCGLKRHMRDNGRPELNFFTDPSFKHFQDCLDAEMKRLTGMGIGSNVKEAQAFSEGEENKL